MTNPDIPIILSTAGCNESGQEDRLSSLESDQSAIQLGNIKEPDHTLLDAKGRISTSSPDLVLLQPRRRWDIATIHGHSHCRTVIEASSDGNFLYFVTDADKKEIDRNQGQYFKSIAKLNLRTNEVKKIINTGKGSIYSIAARYGFIAYCDYSTICLYHEPTQKMLLQVDSRDSNNSIPGVTFSQVNNLQLAHVGDKFLLVAMCNGGRNPLFEIKPESEDTFKVSYFDTCLCPLNGNNAAFGAGQYMRFLSSGFDHDTSAIFFEIQEDSRMKYLEKKIDITQSLESVNSIDPKPKYDSMMSAWMADTPIGAVGIEQGFCVVFNFETGKVIATLRNAENKLSTLFGEDGQIRIVAFSSKYPILIFAESKRYLHAVDMRTWHRQILTPPPTMVLQPQQYPPGVRPPAGGTPVVPYDIAAKADINGISWVPDKRILYVAFSHCIQEYFLSYGVPSLMDLCVDKIVGMKNRWKDLGWEAEKMPWQVNERC